MIKIEVDFQGEKREFPVTEAMGHENVPSLKKDWVFNMEHLFLLESLQEDKGHTYIFGGTGLGKTESAMYLAGLLGVEVYYISMTGETTPDRFIGGMVAINGNTKYRPGKLLNAMARNGWLIVDEIDYGMPSILSGLNMALAQGFYSIDETGNNVYAGPGFRTIATANTNGAGDETGFYQGTNSMNRALLDRFASTIEYTFPNEEELERILKASVSSTYDFSKIIQLSSSIIKGISDNTLYMTWGLRSVINFAKKMNKYHPRRTAWDLSKLAFANSLDSSTKATLEKIVNNIF